MLYRAVGVAMCEKAQTTWLVSASPLWVQFLLGDGPRAANACSQLLDRKPIAQVPNDLVRVIHPQALA